MPDDNSKICFPKALEEELNAIKKRRAKRVQPGEAGAGVETGNGQAMSKEADVLKEALEMDLVGLALSGGGIRSATFSLCLLQGLAPAAVAGFVRLPIHRFGRRLHRGLSGGMDQTARLRRGRTAAVSGQIGKRDRCADHPPEATNRLLSPNRRH
jgi:hypothetical protein